MNEYFNRLNKINDELAEGSRINPINVYQLVLKEVEPPLLNAVMEFANNNQSKAAEILGINRTTLRTKLKKYNINKWVR